MAERGGIDKKQLQDLVQSPVWTPEEQVLELKRRMDLMEKFMVLQGELSFKPRPTDVICSVPPKNGTTWLTHICHQIRMQGAEPDFREQLDVVCYLSMNEDTFGTSPEKFVQPAQPRIYFSHLTYADVPKDGKLIFMYRDQKDALYSMYLMTNSGAALKGRVSLDTFAQITITSGSIEERVKDLLVWWEHRFDDNVLLLFYDDLKEDHVGSVRRIAKFMGVDCSEEVIARVVHTTTHSEMAKNASKFNISMLMQFLAENIEAPVEEKERVGRVRVDGGKSNSGSALPLEVQKQIDQLWKEIVTTKLGFKSLKEMRDEWHKERTAKM